MRRRLFVTLLVGSTAMWPALGRSQPGDRVRRIAVLIPFSGNDEFWRDYLAAFAERLQALGWTEGRNVRFDRRLVAERGDDIRAAADELLALKPDIVFVTTNPAVAVVTKGTRSIPIVFASASDAVGSGFVASIAHPGGNVTGFQNYELSIIGKWMEILKQIAPGVRRVAVIHDPQIGANVSFVRLAEDLSASLGLKVVPGGVHEAPDVERVLTAFAREPDGGLVVAPNPINAVARAQIVDLAAALKLPARLPLPLLSGDRRPRVLWLRSHAASARGCVVRRPHPARRPAGRSAGTASDQVRIRDQPQDGQGARAGHPAVRNVARRRRDRLRLATK